LLIVQEKMVAVQNIQASLRSLYQTAPFLTEEACQLVFHLSNVLAIFESVCTVTPLTAYEALEPLLSVLDNKIVYLKGKKAGIPSNAVGAVLAQQNAPSQIDKELEKKATHDTKGGSREPHRRRRRY
jgi:hypothetical protein